MLTPEQRTLRARLAAYELHSRSDGLAVTEAARASGPGRIDYWLAKVDPDHQLPDKERCRRAKSAKSAHFARLALASSKARAKKKAS